MNALEFLGAYEVRNLDVIALLFLLVLLFAYAMEQRSFALDVIGNMTNRSAVMAGKLCDFQQDYKMNCMIPVNFTFFNSSKFLKPE